MGDSVVSGSGGSTVQIWDSRLLTESKLKIHGHSDRCMEWRSVKMGRWSLPLRRTEQFDYGMLGLETRSGHHWKVTLVSCGAFDSVVSGSDDKTLRLWDVETHTQIWDPFEGHTDPVLCVSFSSDGRRGVSVSDDNKVRIWDAATHNKSEGHCSQIRQMAGACQRVLMDVTSRLGILKEAESFAIARPRRLYGNRNMLETFLKNRRHDEENGSKKDSPTGCVFENKIADEDAEAIIRSCGQQNPHLLYSHVLYLHILLNCNAILDLHTIWRAKTV